MSVNRISLIKHQRLCDADLKKRLILIADGDLGIITNFLDIFLIL